ncbi:hypothetical protein MED134_00445 [Dokdonia sp. MED134]|uniref:DUF1801 domain-containing protein n=1 Tax=Dokdonia sp. MED134 TaxID=313590 RepID=UPI0000689F00|nr:DUF1801 domain-containing protein [Dokdonia sp. MED134]EAQ39042.1 hypothetical protein MED134_00445 [Dokdonia sp. MED134]
MNPAQAYILSKPEPWRTMLIELQAIIKSTVPEVEETYKWNLPFYMLDGKMFCFLNFRKSFIDVGFPRGVQITVHKEVLVGGEKRKNLRSLRYKNMKDIDYKVFMDVLLNFASRDNLKK